MRISATRFTGRSARRCAQPQRLQRVNPVSQAPWRPQPDVDLLLTGLTNVAHDASADEHLS
jgi:hypothetical protein